MHPRSVRQGADLPRRLRAADEPAPVGTVQPLDTSVVVVDEELGVDLGAREGAEVLYGVLQLRVTVELRPAMATHPAAVTRRDHPKETGRGRGRLLT
jgi:hypothetical protein